MSLEARSKAKAFGAIALVAGLIAVGFLPFAWDVEGRRVLVFIYALVAVILGVCKVALTIWIHRDETPDVLAMREEEHKNNGLLLDVFTVVFGAPAAFLGAFSFLILTPH